MGLTTEELRLILTARDEMSKTVGAAGQTLRASLGSIGASMTKAGAILSATVTAPLVLFSKQATDTAVEFDRQMRNIQSISKQSDESLTALGQTFIALSTDLTQTTDSATNLAAGFYNIQSSGFAGADALTVLQASSKAASAGLTDTNVASQAIVAALNAYGLTAKDATTVSDTLFKTVDIGVLSFDELASQIGDVMPTAAVAKVPLNDLGAAIATMTKGGISAAESTTALNQVMMAFIDPSKEARKAAAAMGVDLSASALASKGLGGALADVAKKTGGSIEKMSMLFGNVRALKGALSLTRDGMKPFSQDLLTLAGSAVATQAAFEQQTKSFAAQSANMKNQFDEIKIALGNILLTLGTGFLPVIKQLIDGFMALSPETQRMIVLFGIAAAALGPVLMVLGGVVTALGAILSPVGLVILAIGALVAAFVAASGGIGPAVENVKTAATSVWTVVQNVFNAIWGFIQPVVAAIVAFAVEKFGFITAWIQENMPLIQRTVQAVMTAVLFVVREVLERLSLLWNAAWPVIVAVLEVAWELIKGVVTAALTLVMGIIKAIMQLITGDWEGAWNTILSTVQQVLTDIFTAIGNVINLILAKFGTSIPQLVAVVTEWVNAAWAVITSKVSEWVAAGYQLIVGFVSGVEAGAKRLIEAVEKAIGDAIQAAKNLLGIKSPSMVFRVIGENTMKGMALGIEKAAWMPKAASGQATQSIVNYNYYLSANYRNTQSEGSLRDTVRMLQMATG
ncbi:MAG TPA: phage tail tape measure protein [Verrucomicrobiota bacterium]|nr:phage tail tape measure protein [Verrucomicrobiota bacterium]